MADNPDYRSMFDSEFLGHWDLQGRDVTVTIRSVKAGEVVGEKGRKSKKPVVFFEKTEKGMFCNKTNGKVIAALYGNDTRSWVGKQITLYATTTEFGGKTVECIRVRPSVPKGKTQSAPAGEREPGGEG